MTLLARRSARRHHLFACSACGGDLRAIFTTPALLCLCLPCAATYSRVETEGVSTCDTLTAWVCQ